MGHSIALNFEDGVTRFIECRPDETIADASYRVGINIPLDCRDGVCGTCKCRVEAGEYDRGNYLEDALTEEEAAAGLALACQTRPKTNLVVSIAASSAACKTPGQMYRARLHSVERLSEATIAFSLAGANGVSFLPGKYANLLVPGTEQRRSYSFSSPPGAEPISFMARNIPPGMMSTYLREKAVPGTPIEFIGPADYHPDSPIRSDCTARRELYVTEIRGSHALLGKPAADCVHHGWWAAHIAGWCSTPDAAHSARRQC
jgi:benzoate/toluate 1,2-dioxygenase reductase subunit